MTEPIIYKLLKNNYIIDAAENFVALSLRLEERTNEIKILLDGEVTRIINYYGPQSFKILNEIASSPSVIVYNVYWKGISKFAIKKFKGSSSKEAIDNEIHLTQMANSHPNIIQFHGITKLRDEINYSLVLEYAEGGTLGKYLRDDTISFKWENQLKFAKEIASAVSWLHDDVGIIHGDIKKLGHNILSLRSSETQRHSYPLTEKADIYSLGVLFWELTSRKSPFDFETKNNDSLEIFKIMSKIFNGTREKPLSDTNHKFVALYERCWQHEPHERPEIGQIISEINNIELDNFSPKNINVSITFTLKKNEANEDLYLSD
ncbi:kinase-like domain-containing protein [Rhizophagus clarus]|uniref:Kinase-like domain-containing protein n=1 Tax=Rhizophagus clarus TaxID=94130 RepID=A0A8H3KV63_9GLOM|nr:kinase-like domain-containing protein [Rhizophagus clarus]